MVLLRESGMTQPAIAEAMENPSDSSDSKRFNDSSSYGSGMSISARRKSVFENQPSGSKIRQTHRRAIKAVIPRDHPCRVNAAELARRKFLHLATGAAALPAMSRIADAQAYPARPVTIIVPFAAGGGADVVVRLLTERMRESLGQPIIVENVSGANGSVGIGRVARARPDGYTIDLGASSTHVLNGALYSLPYDVLNDFEPISPLVRFPLVLFGRTTMSAKDLNELIVWLKANPDKASAGIAAAAFRIETALLQKQTGTTFTLVPYRGSAPAMQDLVAGQIDMMFDVPTSLPLVRAGSIKAYAVTSDTRWAQAPDIPTFVEMGMPALSYSSWWGFFAPRGTPKDIIGKLNAAATDALVDRAVRSRIADLGMDIFPRERQTPEALGALVKDGAETWWPLIKEFGIKAE
jgi:tripartite-type tricarboxylate transporter receptor subunit TctC